MKRKKNNLKEKSKEKKEEEEKNKIVMFLYRNQISQTKCNVAQWIFSFFSPYHQKNVQLQSYGAMALRIFLVVKME
jgi:hypothetical protein